MMAQQIRPLHIVLDFDGTLTSADTTAVLGSITSISGTRTAMSWDEILSAYMSDYNAHRGQYVPSLAERTTLAEEAGWLNSLRPIEQRSSRRVEEAGVFRGVTAGMIAELAKSEIDSEGIKMRKGWKDLLCIPSFRPSTQISILSVNWSRTFIRQVLLAAARKELGRGAMELEGNINSVAIYANEIEGLDRRNGSDGKLGSGSGIRTSGDKLSCLEGMISRTALKQNGEFTDGLQSESDNTEKPMTVYVGDSPSDLECIAAADLGVCVRDEQMGSGQRELAACFERIGIDALPVEEVLTQHPPARPTAYSAGDIESLAKVLDKL